MAGRALAGAYGSEFNPRLTGRPYVVGTAKKLGHSRVSKKQDNGTAEVSAREKQNYCAAG